MGTRALYWIKVILLAAGYFLLAKISLHFAAMAGQVSPVWLPSGFTLAALLLGGVALWPGIALGSAALQLSLSMPLWVAGSLAVGATVEALLAWYLLRRVFRFRNDLGSVRHVAALIVSCALIAAPLNALIGSTTLCVAGHGQWNEFATLLVMWWIPNATACLTVTPSLLVWGKKQEQVPRRFIELVALAVVLGAILGITFAGSRVVPTLKLEYGVFPVLIWAAIRFRQRGAVFVMMATAAFAVWATLTRVGPFSTNSVTLDLILLQTFLATVALTGLVVAAITAERTRANAALAATNAKLESRIQERTAALSKANAFMNSLFESAGAGITACDSDGRVTVINRYMRSLFSPDPSPARIQDWEGFKFLYKSDGRTPMTREELPLERALTGETVRETELVLRAGPSDAERVILTHAQPIIGDDLQVLGAVVVAHDITDRKQAEERLRHRSRHDSLTDLPNRTAFLENLVRVMGHALRRPQYAFAVLFLDLDRFKVINDSLGHMVGDQLLVEVGKRLQSCIRTGDLVARIGGDEFTILLDDIQETGPAAEAGKVAERILDELSAPFNINGAEIFTGTSIGIAISTTGYSTAEKILRDADTAMYRAKELGKGRYEIFDAEMHGIAMGRLQLETDLHGALDRGEFFLNYQPILSLIDRRIIGFEALVRWNHPKRGLVSPADFIPVAEETGIIVPLGQWVLEEACRWLAVRITEGHDLTISVNLSPRQFSQKDIVRHIRTALAASGLESSRLKLEITENALMSDITATAGLLAELRAIKVRIHIDDFGTGYSSLSYLSRLPIDALKIDQAFIREMSGSSEDMEIVRSVLALGRALGMETVAEGIETEEQAFALEQLGCPHGQGFLFSRPLAGDEAATLLLPSVSF